MVGLQPWHELPPAVADALRPVLAEVADEMIEAVRTIPAYSRPLDGEFGEGVRAGVNGALGHFLAEVEAGGPVERPEVYRALGRGEMRAGRSLDALLSAYRIGARVAWRRFAAAGEAAGLAPPTLYLMAEALFAYIDVLSAESAEGHALERSAAAGEAELRRRRLVRLLVREPAADAAAVELAAVEAGWELPRTLAALALDRPRGEADDATPAEGRMLVSVRGLLPADAIADTIGEFLCLIVPDPEAPGRRAELERLVARLRVPAGMGNTVGWPDAATSFTRARAALALAPPRSGSAPPGSAPPGSAPPGSAPPGSAPPGSAPPGSAPPGSPPGALILARERAGEILLASAPALAREFAADRLSPLDGQTPRSRARLTETLRAWLAEQGRLSPVAQRLGVHPQTARYRIARLRDLFGTALDDPDERFWLDVALRVSGDAG